MMEGILVSSIITNTFRIFQWIPKLKQVFLFHYVVYVTAGYTPEKAEKLELSFLLGMSRSGKGWYMETFQFFSCSKKSSVSKQSTGG